MVRRAKAFLTSADLERERAAARAAQPAMDRTLRIMEARASGGSPVARLFRVALAASGFRPRRA